MFREWISKANEDKAEREFLSRVHHILMRNYGWIPLEELKKIPISTLFSLLEMIKEEKEEERKQKESSKKGRR